MTSRIRYWAKLVAIILVVTVVVFILAIACVEGYLRMTIPSSSGGSIFETTTATKRYKVMKRDARIIAWGREFRTNNLGFRDNQSEVPAKTPSEFRVIVLGDSFTASAGVDFEKIYTRALEKDLLRQLPDTRVLNLAVGGYNIIQYALVLEEVGLSLAPDLVVVAVFPFNDLTNETYRANVEAAAAGNAATPTAMPWYRELYTYRVFVPPLEWRVRALLRSPEKAAARATNPDLEQQENLSALAAIFESASAHQIGALAVLLPNTDDFASQHGQFAVIERFCRERRLPCVSLLDPFIASGVNPRSLRLNLLDGHPNEHYNALVSRFMIDHVARFIPAERQGRRHVP